ncbi:G-type lectin S-receptor-like serine/threonine-protein kinase At2g19130 [Linum perenne]
METLLWMFSLLILSLLCLNNKLRPCHGIDMITATQSLTGDQTLVSAGGVFELGFFNPGESESYYIGIWYKQVSPRTVIWVANRDNPVFDRFSAELKISDDGELALFDGGANYATWSRQTYNSSSSVKAVLLDQGNLVLLQTNGSSSSPLWQSFDEPGDTWVPGCKIGFNNVTKREAFLTSWKNREDPAPDTFYLRLGSQQSLVSNFGGGLLNSEIRITESSIIKNFVYVNNQNERSITFSQYNRTQIDKIVEEESDQEIQLLWHSMHKSKYSNDSLFSRYVVYVVGQIQLLIWAEFTQQWIPIWKYPRSNCEINGYCGAYASCKEKSSYFCDCLEGFVSQDVFDDPVVGSSYMEGCNRRYPLQCEKPDWFFPYYNVTLPDYPNITSAASSQDCKTTCLRSCSCNAYSYNEDKQCFHWYVMLYNLQLDIPNGETIYIKLAASEFSTYVNKMSGIIHQKRNKIAIMIGSVVGSSVLLVLVLFIIFRWRHHIMLSPTNLMEGSLVVFTYRHLKIYTKNFSDKLAEGGFGAVYKGTLPDSSVVAVKKLERINFRIAENHEQFLAEVRTLGTIQHINLVGLRGFSSDKSTMMLVYDYMPNGSVASHLFKGNDDSNILDWKTRYSIALGTARGLAYLHENCRECIIHYDIKPENVFLDSEFRPKVADFGMEKLFGRDFNRVLTTLKGTIGYLAPEWISGEAITAKADVYSYGMVLFELVSGMRNSQRHVCVGHYFPLWVANVINEGGNVAELLDPKLQGNADVEELERVCRVALWCIQNDQSHRPTMSHVVYFLEQVLEVNIPPVPRILKVFVDPDPEN